MPSRLLYAIIFGFAGGILLRSFVVVPEKLYPWFVGYAALALVASFFFKKRKKVLLLVAVGGIAAALGVLRYDMSEQAVRLPYEEEVGKEIVAEGVISNEVERRESNQRFVVVTDDEKVSILVTTDLYPSYQYGDVISVTGTLKKPENFQTDQGKEFDYESYLGKDDIFYTMSFAKVSVLGHDAPSRLQEGLFAFKAKLTKHIEAVVPRPESTFLGGIALGSRAGISAELRDQFVRTGTIHIVALSGYNISIVAKYIQEFFAYFLSYYFSLAAGAIAIILFVIMTGAQATAVRAGIMALLVVLAKFTGRTYEITRALVIAGFFMIFHNPKVLAFDVSFQLSFLATLGIVYGTPIFEYVLGKREGEKLARTWQEKAKRFMRDITATTFAAQVAVLPFILFQMGTLSLISFPINIVILPFIPIAMFIGFGIAFLGFFGSWLTLPLGYAVTLLLSLILSCITWGAHFQNALVSVRHFPLVVMLALYIGVIWAVYAFFSKRRTSGQN